MPTPFERKCYDDNFFSVNKIEERTNEYKKVFKGGNKQQEFIDRISDSNFTLEYLDVLNEVVNDVIQIIPYTGETKQRLVQELISTIEKKIVENRNNLEYAQTALNGTNPIEAVEKILKMSFDVFTKDFFTKLINEIISYVKKIERLDAFSKEESVLHNFCIEHNIPEFKMQYSRDGFCNEFAESTVYFSSDLLGGEAFEKAETVSRGRKMVKEIEEKDLLLNDAKHTKIYTKWNPLTKGDFEAYFNNLSES